VRVREVLDIAGDIDGQIYMRDFKLIDQSDMIVSYIPELPGGGIPGLSSGVERELQHAFEHTRRSTSSGSPKAPSPFITETATKVFASVDEALGALRVPGHVRRLGMSLYAIHITAIWLFYSVTMGGQFLGAGSMTSWSGALSWLLPLAPVPIGAALWVFAPRLARWTCAGLRP
jgi:hypothetical protein